MVKTVGDTVYIGGDFTEIFDDRGNRLTRNYLAALDRNTGMPTSFHANVNEKVWAIEVSEDESTLFIGGTFNKARGKSRPRFAAFDLDSGNLTNFSPDRPNNVIRELHVDGDILYVGGMFTEFGNVQRSRLAAFDLNTETLTSWNPKASARITSIIADGTKVWIGGDFRIVNGTAAKFLAAVRASNGSLIDTEHVIYPVIDLAKSGNQLFVSGGGPGGRGAAFNMNTGLKQWEIWSDGNFQAVDAEEGPYVYFGGHYENVEDGPGGTRHRIGRMARHLKSTGELDTSWAPWFNGIRSINTVDVRDDAVYVGGDFTFVSRDPRDPQKGFAFFSGSTD